MQEATPIALANAVSTAMRTLRIFPQLVVLVFVFMLNLFSVVVFNSYPLRYITRMLHFARPP